MATVNDTDFPLRFHKPSGHYVKTVKGKRYYLGKDPDEAVAVWKRYKADFYLGIDPRKDPAASSLRLQDACNLFLESKDQRVKSGEMKRRSWLEYRDSYRRLIDHFGADRDAGTLTPELFNAFKAEIAKIRRTPTTLGNEITRIRQLFLWLRESGHVTTVRFGPDFRKPSAKAIRRHRREQDRQLLEPHEIVAAINELGVHYRACALLGISCGFGPHDCETLPRKAVDLEAGEINYARPKTEQDRRCPVWPEVAEALELSSRYSTHKGSRFFDIKGGTLSRKFRTALRSVGAYRSNGTDLYSLRHCFATVAREANDDTATRIILGHVDDSILDSNYTHRFPRERLDNVSEHVRAWLFGGAATCLPRLSRIGPTKGK